MPYKDPAKKKTAYDAFIAQNPNYQAERYQKNKERLRPIRAAHHAAYREANKESLKAQKAAWYQANKARQNEKRAARHQAHREEENAVQRARLQANPELNQTYIQQRRARKAAAPLNDLTRTQWLMMKAHYHYRCVYCGKKPKRLTIDHLTPMVQGGSHTLQNVVPACGSCNSRKNKYNVLKPVQPMLL